MIKVEQLLEALKPYRNELSRWAANLRQQPGIESADFDLSLQHYESGSTIEAYLEAELPDGHAVVWYLDITPCYGGWTFATRLVATDENGEHDLQRLPEQHVSDISCISRMAQDAFYLLDKLWWHAREACLGSGTRTFWRSDNAIAIAVPAQTTSTSAGTYTCGEEKPSSNAFFSEGAFHPALTTQVEENEGELVCA